jgi:pantetheine-phosphate adenylyltransferase
MTYGHLDLIERSADIFESLIVAVAATVSKPNAMFGLDQRMAMVREVVADRPNVRVLPLDGLLVTFCRQHDVRVVVRGLRAYSDFEYEFQMALTNRKLAPEIETLFLMPLEEHSYVTASTVREVARYGGDTRAFVPPTVQGHLERHLRAHPEEHRAATGGRSGNGGAFDR